MEHEMSGSPQESLNVTTIIQNLGIPAHMLGYVYLREAILLAVDNPAIIHMVTKELYPAIAKHFDTTPSRVERAIRHAIELAWDHGDIETTIHAYTNNPAYMLRKKPSNAQLIATISDWIWVHKQTG